MASTSAIALGRRDGSDAVATSTSHLPPGKLSSTVDANRTPTRLLPTPPGPTNVNRRVVVCSSTSWASSERRPTKLLTSCGRLPVIVWVGGTRPRRLSGITVSLHSERTRRGYGQRLRYTAISVCINAQSGLFCAGSFTSTTRRARSRAPKAGSRQGDSRGRPQSTDVLHARVHQDWCCLTTS